MSHRLLTTYRQTVRPLLTESFSYQNIHQVPKIEKIVVKCATGDAAQNAKGLEAAMNDMALVTGQRPVKTRGKASVSTFRHREGQPTGMAVTLRGHVMYSFLERIINLGIPRTGDFQGVNPNSFDGNGNLRIALTGTGMGMIEQGVFPEIVYDDAVGKARQLDVCITTTAETDTEGHRLLALMGMPFREGSGSRP